MNVSTVMNVSEPNSLLNRVPLFELFQRQWFSYIISCIYSVFGGFCTMLQSGRLLYNVETSAEIAIKK
jgi:hypothetical protein